MKRSIVTLLHIGYWLIYWLLVSFLILATFQGRKHIPFSFFVISPIPVTAILPGIISFYTAYFFLFSNFLARKKIGKLIGMSALISLLLAGMMELVLYTVYAGYGINWTQETCIGMGLFLAGISLVHIATALVMRGFIQWFEDIRLKADLDKRNYETELALLKSQLNPHFLFNTINNIDTLITKDAASASAYLNQLSDIMRFMLYETKTEKIPLLKELTYIEKFIALQKIRTTNEQYIHYSVTGDATGVMIPPMLFIPFLENAFKHAENKKAANAIDIRLAIDRKRIVFRCENSFNPQSKLQQEGSGLGSELIRKRLALMYPGKHTLSIRNNHELYTVELSLDQDEN